MIYCGQVLIVLTTHPFFVFNDIRIRGCAKRKNASIHKSYAVSSSVLFFLLSYSPSLLSPLYDKFLVCFLPLKRTIFSNEQDMRNNIKRGHKTILTQRIAQSIITLN